MGRVCESCGLTRWEGHQVEGWVEHLRGALSKAEAELASVENVLRSSRYAVEMVDDPDHTTSERVGYVVQQWAAACDDADDLERRAVRLRDERDRANETRENANDVSVRVEIENHRLTDRLTEARKAARDLMSVYMADGDLDPHVERLAAVLGLGQQEGS